MIWEFEVGYAATIISTAEPERQDWLMLIRFDINHLTTNRFTSMGSFLAKMKSLLQNRMKYLIFSHLQHWGQSGKQIQPPRYVGEFYHKVYLPEVQLGPDLVLSNPRSYVSCPSRSVKKSHPYPLLKPFRQQPVPLDCLHVS